MLLPELMMVRYEAPDHLGVEALDVKELPRDWRRQEAWTQQRGDDWHGARQALLLRVPSASVPLEGSPDVNFLINHKHQAVADIRTVAVEPFVLDPRLF